MTKKSSTYPEGKGLILLLISFLTLLCLLSFDADDRKANWLGLIGHGYAWLLVYLWGLVIYPIVGFTGWVGWKFLVDGAVPKLKSKLLYLGALAFSLTLLLSLMAEKKVPVPGALRHKILTETLTLSLPFPHHTTRHNLGGVPAYFLYRDLPSFSLQQILSDVGVGITFFLTAALSFLFLTEISLIDLFEKAKELPKKERQEAQPPPPELEEMLYKKPQIRIRTTNEKEEKIPTSQPTKKNFSGYELPSPSLLSNPKKVDQPMLKKELRRQAELLEESLLSFGIEAKVGDINCGPTITSFEVHPAVGVKVQKITTLESDIALNLQAKSIRIIAPIPGKAAVGIEIPSPHPQEVSFKEMLVDYQQSQRKLQIPIILGKTVTGDNVMSDLAKMPHCLIAGATGSGKSVCINTIIMSIVMNARPDEIKMLMVDPKKVELTPYTDLPHLIAPVITEPHGALAALQWLVREMQVRYEILKQLGLRNISAFNGRDINASFEASLGMPVPEKMPYIVAIIDEFADLMMASSSDLETPIARIAQMARAVGIHLILATQRPSREVITGLIKANFPTRIAFKVASRVNSQIILDENGAESLLGNGDLLFLPPGSSHLVRAQGSFISDTDINTVLKCIKAQAPSNYQITSFDSMAKEASEEDGNPRDDLYEEAKTIVMTAKTASTTYLQRKLNIGYPRAASLMDELEARGVISSQEGSKPRRVLIDESNS
jgi:S-DNA-T family DNA segregation ATPase FtsK/SpoIIIE